MIRSHSVETHRGLLPAALVLGTALLSGCGGGSSEPPAPPPGAIPAGEVIGSAAITGQVRFLGTPLERRPIRMGAEPSCLHPGEDTLSEEAIVDPGGTIQNVYVHVVEGLGDRAFAPPDEPVRMDQKGCIFVPHVLAAQTGQVIEFSSSDPVVHNVRAVAERNRTFNVSMSGRGRVIRRFFSLPEIVKIRCDIHAWMAAYIAVADHPFYDVTGEGGTFALSGLPGGDYVIEAWHEKFGTARQEVTLADGERREIEFSFEDESSR